jgi:hypothetical protein
VEARLQKQARGPNSSVFDDNDNVADDSSSDEPEPQPAPGASVTSDSRIVHKDLDQKFRFWQSRALKMAKAIERRDAAMAGEPSVQFPLAAIHRQRTSFLKSDEIYRRHVGQEFATPWSQAAAGEIWLSNSLSPPAGPVTPCGFTPSRPVLDGVLSDACWQDAAELPLVVSAKSRKGEGRSALAMLCYDAEFLYLAASLPRAKGVRTDGAVEGERRHDEDVADFDRVMFSLDVDRDYVTYYNFTVDQRGCTAESCWEDPSWNPRWLVAVGGDKTHWRLEAAIPLEELTPLVPQSGSAWAIGITRIIPAVGIESWTHPSSASPRAENFGILRFDAPGDPR